jgi:hypothetical protein
MTSAQSSCSVLIYLTAEDQHQLASVVMTVLQKKVLLQAPNNYVKSDRTHPYCTPSFTASSSPWLTCCSHHQLNHHPLCHTCHPQAPHLSRAGLPARGRPNNYLKGLKTHLCYNLFLCCMIITLDNLLLSFLAHA